MERYRRPLPRLSEAQQTALKAEIQILLEASYRHGRLCNAAGVSLPPEFDRLLLTACGRLPQLDALLRPADSEFFE
ncbi:MAG: hypothetical protein Fur0046_18170 [Cyanobacteria bacterium J069]|nr:MAG: hypothetical protein D6742_04305 [Cyanobacteria bacterium J069]